ncbi:MAG: hypothetical protein ACHQNV_00785, partial [Vicinamibacteria bacterium]
MIRKDMPGSAAQPKDLAEGSSDGLFTADDLFGDLVDAPLTGATPRPPTRGGPVKVQIAEKNRPQEVAPATAEVPAEEMASLVEAFGHGGAAPEAPPTPASAAQKPEASPIASGGDEVDALLDVLSAVEEPRPSAPPKPTAVVAPEPTASPETPPSVPAFADSTTEHEEAQELGLLLDGLSEEEPAPAPRPAADAIAPETQPAEEFGGLLDALSEHIPEAVHIPSPRVEPPPEAEPAPAMRPAGTAEGDFDQMLSSFLDAAPANVPLPPPASRLDIKFQAAPPRVQPAAETRAVIDLAALADEALSLPLTRPGIAVPPPSEDATPSSGGGSPDAFGPYRLLERIAAGGMAE